MRLWSLHPKYLDTKGLTALWRESLLAQKVLAGNTVGYRNHPQLLRFSAQAYPGAALSNYLLEIWREADRRGYRFDKEKILKITETEQVPRLCVNRDQLYYERDWLCQKLQTRDPKRHTSLIGAQEIDCHPLFEIIEGPVEAWENIQNK